MGRTQLITAYSVRDLTFSPLIREFYSTAASAGLQHRSKSFTTFGRTSFGSICCFQPSETTPLPPFPVSRTLRAVEPILHADRPQLVFDLSSVRQLDSAGVDMLLHCMSEAMKRDGDVKLAAPSAEAMVILELTRTGRLFEIYDSATDAARSYSSFLPNVMRQFSTPDPQPFHFPALG